MIETVKLNDPSIAEEIRKNMALSTPGKNGLMPASYYRVFNRKTIGFDPNQTVEIGKVYGLLYISNRYINDGIGTLYSCGISTVEKICGVGFGFDFTIKDNVLSATSKYGTVGTFEFLFQFIL